MSERQGCIGPLVALAGIWVASAALLGQLAVWLADQIALVSGQSSPWWGAALGSTLAAALAAAPVGLLLAFARAPRLRAMLHVWLLACVGGGLLGLARALPPSWVNAALLAQAAVCLALAAGLWLRRPALDREQDGAASRAGAALLGLALGALAALPWLRAGALGSWFDTLAALAAAAGFALAAGLLVERLMPAAGEGGFGAGLAASAAIMALGGGLSLGGTPALLLLALAPLGLLAVALGRLAGRPALAVAGLLLAPAAAPLALLDPNELTLLLDDLLGAAYGAAMLALLLGVLLDGALLIAAGRRRSVPLAAGGAALALALAAGGALGAGLRGGEGDRLFVVLREQAALPALSGSGEARVRPVYQQLVASASERQAGLRALLVARGVAYTPYYLMNAIEVHADDPWLRAELAARPEVDRVIDSQHLRPPPQPPTPDEGPLPAPASPEWNITSIGADRVWDELGVTGAGVLVGQLDSGVDGAHPALSGGYAGRAGGDDYRWLDPWGGSASPRDLGGHGTYTLGLAVGRDGIGVAPGAEWIGCVVLERNLGSPARYLDCLQFMLAPYPQGGDPFTEGDPARAPQVINNSWGCPELEGCDPEALRPAVEALRAAGIFVVAAAGNEGPGCSSVADPIGLYDAVYAVGAVDESGEAASFSSRGPVASDGSGRAKPDIAAPGDAVLSSMPGGGYAISSGTSAAAPHVAGAVALMWSASPRLAGDIEATERILAETAQAAPLTDECGGSANVYGAGLLDVYAAVRAARALP